jgi:heterodisulfide reductase subunit B
MTKENYMSLNESEKQISIKKLGFFPGCIASTEQYGEEMSLREILPKMGVTIETPQGLSCCGGPLRSINSSIPQFLAVRNLAIFEKEELDIFTPCPQCHLVFTRILNMFKENPDDLKDIQTKLKEEGLEFTGKTSILHTVDLIHDYIGLDKLKKIVVKPFKGQSIAAHYGCHLLRPSSLERPDYPEHPKKMEGILETLGLKTANYPERLNCCGALIYMTHQESALTKTGQKLTAVQNRKFDALSVSCPWGYRMFDTRQESAAGVVGEKLQVPIYTLGQLIGLALNINQEKLGIHLNKSPRGAIIDKTSDDQGGN